MTIVGVILLIVGLVGTALDLSNNMPEAVVNIGIPLWAWIAVMVAGALLIYFNRRPGN